MPSPVNHPSAGPPEEKITAWESPPSPGLGMLVAGGLVCWLLFILWHEKLPQALYANDRSYICLVISLLFLFMLAHCGIRATHLTRQAAYTTRVERLLTGGRGPLRRTEDQWWLADRRLPSCPALQLISHIGWDKLRQRDGPDSDAMREFLATLISKGNHLGWFCSDVMIKLGLLGTVIGFILMLRSITHIEDLDIAAMQTVLHDMGTGMATALYTTLSGLGCGMILGALYYLLDDYADSLIDRNRRLLELRLPALMPG